MSEKRFIVVDHSTCVFDKITKEEYVCIDREEAFLVCKRLNEQQATIEQLQEEIEELKREIDDWKSSTCSYMNKDSILSMDCQIVQEALWELEKEIEFGSKSEDLFFDLKEKFEKLNNHRIGVF